MVAQFDLRRARSLESEGHLALGWTSGDWGGVERGTASGTGLFLSPTASSIRVATPRGSSWWATWPPGKVRIVQPRETARCQLLSVLARSSADLSFGTKAT